MKKLFMAVLFLSLSCMTTLARAEFAVANVQTPSGNHYFWKTSAPSVSAAEKIAMKNCKEEKKKQGYKSDCVIIGSGKGPVYLAFFEASNGGFGWGYSSDRQSAIDTAYLKCSEYGECPRTATSVVFDEGPNVALVANNQLGKQCSPPTSGTVRYRYSCNNGDCLKTYENGCTIRFQAKQCFNPFTNQWEWKPDGC